MKRIGIFSASIILISLFSCSVCLTGKKTSDSFSALDYARQFAEHKKSGDLQKMAETMIKARYRWFYEKECYPATEKGSRSPGVFMGAFLFASARDVSLIERQPHLFAELLAMMINWQVVPGQDGVYLPGYSYGNADFLICQHKGDELQQIYRKTMVSKYKLMSNPEYQDVVDLITDYEKLSAQEREMREKQYLYAIQRKGELEAEYEPR